MTMEEKSPEPALGYQRQRVLSCVAMQDHFEPEADVQAAFQAYSRRMADKWGHLDDALSVGLIATLALLSGQIDAADRILDTLPNEPINLDHGAGYCQTVPFETLCAVFPLPDHLRDIRTWTLGSATEQRLRSWLTEHRARLSWEEDSEAYRL